MRRSVRPLVEGDDIARDEIGQTRGRGQGRSESSGVAGEGGDLNARAQRTKHGIHRAGRCGGRVGGQTDRPEQHGRRRLLPPGQRHHPLNGQSKRLVLVCGWAVERDAVDVGSGAGGEHAALPVNFARGDYALQDERAGVDRPDLNGRELQQVDVPVHVRRGACLHFANLIAGDVAAAALGNGSNELTPRLDVAVGRRNAPERKHDRHVAALVQTEHSLQTCEGRVHSRTGEGRLVDRQPDDRRHNSGQVGRQRLGVQPPVDRDTAQLRVRGEPARRRQQHERREGDRDTNANGHVETGDSPSTSPIGANARASQDPLEAPAEPAEPEIVGEALGRREPDPRGVGVDLPGMHGQRHGNAARVAILDHTNHAAGCGHP